MIHRDQEIGRRKREQTQKTPCEPYAAHYQDEIFCVCDIREEKTQTQLPVILQGNGREMWCFPRADDFQWIVCCLLLLLLLYTPTYKPTRTHILEIDIKKREEKKRQGRYNTGIHTRVWWTRFFFFFSGHGNERRAVTKENQIVTAVK